MFLCNNSLLLFELAKIEKCQQKIMEKKQKKEKTI